MLVKMKRGDDMSDQKRNQPEIDSESLKILADLAEKRSAGG